MKILLQVILMVKTNKNKHIYIIRHGETDFNKKNIIQGSRNNIPLNSNGKEQAKKTGKYLRDYRFLDNTVILTSPLKRATKTARIMRRYINSTLIIRNDITEVDKGILSGQSKHKKVVRNYDKQKKAILDSIQDPIEKEKIKSKLVDMISNIGGKDTQIESDSAVIQRCRETIAYIKECKYTDIIIVSHSGYIDYLLKEMFNICDYPSGDFTNGNNCGIAYIEFKENTFHLVSPPNTLHLGLYE